MGKDDFKLVVTLHHIIEDGWSNSLILGGLLKYYKMVVGGIRDREIMDDIARERSKGEEYGAYIRWIESHDEDEFRTFWSRYLDGYESPADIRPFDDAKTVEHLTGRSSVDLSDRLSEELRTLATQNSVTVSTVLEVAVGILLEIYNGTDDVVFGKVVSGRQAPLEGIDDIVGLFSNTIPVRVTTTRDMTVTDLLRRQHDDYNDCIDYAYGPLSTIQTLTPPRIRARKGALCVRELLRERSGLRERCHARERT